MRRSAGVPIAIRVGLNSGEVVVRSIGSDLRMAYTAVGQTTHLAARMEQASLPGSILLTGSTLALAEAHVSVKPLGPMPVKGLAGPVDVFELTGVFVSRLGLAYAGAGRIGEALPLARDAAARVADANPRDQPLVLAVLAEVCCRAGMSRDARAAAQQALESSRRTSQQGTEARSRWLIAEATRLEDAAGSSACEPLYREALDLAAALEMRPLVAHCHRGLAAFHRIAGNREAAREHVATAAAMYRTMGMHHWLRQVEPDGYA